MNLNLILIPFGGISGGSSGSSFSKSPTHSCMILSEAYRELESNGISPVIETTPSLSTHLTLYLPDNGGLDWPDTGYSMVTVAFDYYGIN